MTDRPGKPSDHAQGTRPHQVNSDPGKLPHERDESAHGTTRDPMPGQENVIERARRDVEAGLEDTDCRSNPSAAPHCPPNEKSRR